MKSQPKDRPGAAIRRKVLPRFESMENRLLLSLTVNLQPEIVARQDRGGATVDIQKSNANSANVQTAQSINGVQLRATANGNAQYSDSTLQVSGEVTASMVVGSPTLVRPETLSVASATYTGTFSLDATSNVTLTGRSTYAPVGRFDGFTGVNVYVTQGGSNDAFFLFNINATTPDTQTRQLSAGTYSFYFGVSTGILIGSNSLQSAANLTRQAGFTFSMQAVPIKSATFTTLSASPSTVTLGNAVVLTSSVVSTSLAFPIATGSVTFSDGAGFSQTQTLDGQGKARISASNLGIGDHEISATYSGDSNHAPSVSLPVTVTIKPIVSLAQLTSIFPDLDEDDAKRYVGPLNAALSEFGITTAPRVAAFLAEVGGESKQLNDWDEDGSDSYLSSYDFSRSLGNTGKGDGKLFRGRGPIQVTGRYNYTYAGPELGYDLLNNPDLLSDTNNPLPGFRAAAWFWTRLVAVERDENDVITKIYVKNNIINTIVDSANMNSQASVNAMVDKITNKVMGVGNPNYSKQAPIRRAFFNKAIKQLVQQN